MPDRPLVSPFIAGDPIRLGADVTSAAQLTTALGLPAPSGVIDLVPGVALVVVPAPRDERLSLRWVQLAHEPALRSGAPIMVPPLRAVFGLVPPSPAEWTLLLGFPVVILLLDEGRKLLQRARG